MILDCVITACNTLPLYYDFIPIFIRSWNKLYPNIDVKIIAQCFGEPTTRMITEAIYIEELPDENSKSEWTFIKLPRVEIL